MNEEALFPLEEDRQPSVAEDTAPAAEESCPNPPKNALRNHEKIYNRVLTALSFLLPFGVATIAYLVSMHFTEGTNMLLSSDGWHQYYPFLVTLRDKLRSGGSMEYSWIVGMGGSFPSLFAYYLASPLYLLSALVPLDSLPHYFTLMTILKLTFAGFFFSWFLRLVYRRKDIAIPFFGLLYSFCAWSAGYYWNIMWLDTFALLPLLIAGMVCLLRDGKFRLYIIALALSLWCNYYVAFFCCIFVLLTFFGYCFCCWNGFANFLRRFFRIGVCTLLGAGLACVVLVPTLLAMQTTYSSTSKEFALLQLNIAEKAYGTTYGYTNFLQMIREETIPGIFSATKEVLTGLMPAMEPTSMEGLPNVFCGLSTVILSIYFFCCKKISWREKLVSIVMLSVIMLSFIVRWLDYVWHGLHFPNMLPYRFSFLFSFVLIAMAYRAFTLLDDLKLWHFAPIAAVTGLLIHNAMSREEFGNLQLLISAGVAGATVIFLLLYFIVSKLKEPKQLHHRFFWKYRKHLALIMLLLLFCGESILSLACGINKIGFTSQYNEDGTKVYPNKGDDVQGLLAYLDKKTNDPLFYRTEVTNTQTLNDAALNNYHGVSIFNSSTNANFNRLTRSFGLASWVGSNRFVYYESSPFTNTMIGIKYLIDRSGKHLNKDYNTGLMQSHDGDVYLLENKAFISVGFMTDPELADFVAKDKKYNPIVEQEEMFRLATGIEDALYEHYSADKFEKPFTGTLRPSGTSGTQYSYTTGKSSSQYQKVSLIYTIEDEGLYIATTKRPTDAKSKVKVYRNGERLFEIDIKVRMLFSLGNFEKGDELKFVYELDPQNSGVVSLDVARQNNDVFDAGIAKLADEPFVLSDFSDGYLRGTIDVKEDGFFYTSVPYEPGWAAYVDGKEVELAPGYDVQKVDVTLSDCVVSFPLSAGTHEIELVYKAPGMNAGLLVSIFCLIIFVTLWILLRKNPVLFPDRPQQKGSRLSHQQRFWLLGIGSVVSRIVSFDLLWVTIHGAAKGYATLFEENPSHLFIKLLSFMKDKKEDEIFILLNLIGCIVLPYTIYLCWRFWSHTWKLLKPAFEKPSAPIAETSEVESLGEEESAQQNQAAEESTDKSSDPPSL